VWRGGGSKMKFVEFHFEGKCVDYLNFTKFFYSKLPSLKKYIKIIETGPKHSKTRSRYLMCGDGWCAGYQ